MPSDIFLLQYTIPLLVFCIFLYFRFVHRHQNLPPSPPKLPVIGNLHQLGKFPHQNLRSLSKKYGDLMLLRLGSKPTVIVSSAEVALQVMKTHDIVFCSRPQLKVMKRILNNGKDMVAAPYGEYWKNMRSICVLELLSKTRVHSFQGVMEEEVSSMVDTIKEVVSSSSRSYGVINMREVFVSLLNNLLYRVVLGRKHGENGSGVEFEKLLRETSELMGRFPFGEFVPWLGWIDKLSGLKSRVDKVANSLDDFLERVLAEQHDDRDKNTESKDFISVLLQVQKNGVRSGHMPIDRDSIKGLLLDMFLAGIESSSGTLEWMMSEVLKSPKVMGRLQEEVRETVEGKDVVTWDDLKRMVYLRATLKESLRLHPPSPLLSPRESRQDMQIKGYDIASGTLVLINAWAIARDPKYWNEPEDFHPDRFFSSSDTRSHDFRMIPFGYGRRACPGESFAVAIIELAMANLLLHFDWSTPPGMEKESLDMRELPGVTIKRMTPLVVAATTRNFLPK